MVGTTESLKWRYRGASGAYMSECGWLDRASCILLIRDLKSWPWTSAFDSF